MKLRTRLLAFLTTSMMFSGAWANDSAAECAEALKTFKGLSSNVGEMMSTAYGYAVLPTIGKGGLGIGGAGGSGCVYAGGKQTGIVKMAQITIGFQAGGQAFSQIILIEDKGTYDEFTSDEFEFGAQASAVALTASAQTEAGTKGASAAAGVSEDKSGGSTADYYKGMAIFTVAKGGLMYEASIGGQKFKFEPLK